MCRSQENDEQGLLRSADGWREATAIGSTSNRSAPPNISDGVLPAITSDASDAADDGTPEVGVADVTFGAYEEQRPIDFDLNYRTHVVFVPGEKSVLDLPARH